MLNVIDFGAKGDGLQDDTKAFQSAIDRAAELRVTVQVPDGVYSISTLHMKPHTGLIGNPAWSFRENGGSILRLNDPHAPCLINLSKGLGATLHGLCLDGVDWMGDTVHGIMVDLPGYGGDGAELTPRIERCRINDFSGNGIHLHRIWCFSIRHNMISHNQGDGIWLQGWDGFILDNWITGNGKAGVGAYEENASITFTANRVEWNHGAGILIQGGDNYNITGNCFDRQGGPAIDIKDRNGIPASQLAITGNICRGSGKPERCSATPYNSSHIRCHHVNGMVLSSNVCQTGQDHEPTSSQCNVSPTYGIVLKHIQQSIIKDNALNHGATKELLVHLGDHGNGVIIKDNTGCLSHIGH